MDKKISMTSVTATFQNPKVAAIIADSVVKKLQEYIIDYRTFKAKEDCLYLEKLFKELPAGILCRSEEICRLSGFS